MSFSQKWERFKDNIGNVKNWIIGRQNKAQSIMQNRPEIVLKVKQHLSSAKTTGQTPPVEQDKDKGRGQ